MGMKNCELGQKLHALRNFSAEIAFPCFTFIVREDLSEK